MARNLLTLALVVCVWLQCACVTATAKTAMKAQAEDYIVEALPGLPMFHTLSFKNYAGFLPLNDPHDTHLFFWFCTSMSDAAKDPVLLWSKANLCRDA